MNEMEKKLVEDNMGLIPKIIHRYITVNENITGLGYDDLYQDASLALCKAALTYNGEAAFPTYAGTVVKNYLISRCRSVTARYAHERPPDDYECWEAELEGTPAPADSLSRVRDCLETAKEGCTPNEQMGMDALFRMLAGYSCEETGRLYGMSGKLVSKRIAAAKKKLKTEPELLQALR